MHLAQRNDRLHAIPVAVLTQRLAVIALVGQDIPAAFAWTTFAAWQADLLQQGHEIAGVGILTGRKQHCQRIAMAVAGQMDLGGQSASAAPETVVLRFSRAPLFPAPLAALVARMEVESTIQVSRSIR